MPELQAIRQICGLLDRGEIDSQQFLEQFTRQMTVDMGCTRAGIWMLIDTADGQALRCAAMYDSREGGLLPVTDMVGSDVTAYFDVLMRDGCVVAPDVHSHPATQGFLADYLLPLDIRSLIDVLFSVNGAPFGLFSCEQAGATIAWTPRHLQLLRRIGSRASLALMHALTNQIDTGPGALWEPSTPNRLAALPTRPGSSRKN